MIPKLITQLTRLLAQLLPGEKAQGIITVHHRYKYPIFGKYLHRVLTSVLIQLFSRTDGWHFFLTKRTYKVDHNKGQVSLPDGVVKDGETFIKKQ